MEEECLVTHETWVNLIRLHGITLWEMLGPTAEACNYYLLISVLSSIFLGSFILHAEKQKLSTNQAVHEGKMQNSNKIKQLYASSHHDCSNH
jgi:hypothetical protein